MAAHQDPLSLGFSRQEHWSGLPFPSPMHESEKWKWSRSVVSDSEWPHGLQPTRLLRPWDFPGKSTGVGCHCLLRGSSLTRNQIHCLLHWQADSLPLSHQGSPRDSSLSGMRMSTSSCSVENSSWQHLMLTVKGDRTKIQGKWSPVPTQLPKGSEQFTFPQRASFTSSIK